MVFYFEFVFLPRSVCGVDGPRRGEARQGEARLGR